MKCLYGIVDVDKGEILFEEEKIFGPSYNLIPGHENIKLVSQDYQVLENHTVAENVLDKLAGYVQEYKEKRVKDLLKICKLTKFANRRAKELSAGQKQRVSIARALADFPKLLLLDEPFNNLDLGIRDEIFSYIRTEMIKINAACLLVSHQPDEALRYSDEVMVFDEGKIIEKASPEDLYKKPKSIEIAKLTGKFNLISKTDCYASKGLKFEKGKLVLRPENLTNSTETSANLTVTVLNNLFCFDKYEVIAKTKSNKRISFYSKSQIKVGKEVYLKIVNN